MSYHHQKTDRALMGLIDDWEYLPIEERAYLIAKSLERRFLKMDPRWKVLIVFLLMVVSVISIIALHGNVPLALAIGVLVGLAAGITIRL